MPDWYTPVAHKSALQCRHISVMCPKSPVTQMFVHQVVQANNKEHTKAPHHWPYVMGIQRCPVDPPHKGPVMRTAMLWRHQTLRQPFAESTWWATHLGYMPRMRSPSSATHNDRHRYFLDGYPDDNHVSGDSNHHVANRHTPWNREGAHSYVSFLFVVAGVYLKC